MCILKKETACDNHFTASKHISHGGNTIRMALLSEWGSYKCEAKVNLTLVQDTFLSSNM